MGFETRHVPRAAGAGDEIREEKFFRHQMRPGLLLFEVFLLLFCKMIFQFMILYVFIGLYMIIQEFIRITVGL